jgi:undecaprenyl-diphosphatase
MINALQRMDIRILNFIDKYLRYEILDRIMPVVTSLGNVGAVWIILSIYLLNDNNYRVYGYIVVTALILALVLGEGIMKHLVKRTRPFIKMSDQKLLIKRPITYSFPSGHAASSFAVAGIFNILNTSGSIYVTIIASMIAFSRCYLKVHYFTDVLVGILIGLFCSQVAVWIFTGRI